MKINKSLIYYLFIFPVFLSATESPAPLSRLGSTWIFGISTQALPSIAYLNSKNIEMTAKELVARKDIKKIFANLSESPLKMQIRRQHYLTKGFAIDDVEISFSIKELFVSGLLNNRIKKTSKNKKLDLSNLKISSLKGLFEVLDKVGRMISSLDLSKNLIDIITDDDFRFYLAGIKNLNLSYNRIRILQSRCFDNLKNLTFLDLGHNRLEFLPFALFANLKLSKLDLSDNPLSNLKKGNFIGIEESLRYLNLGDTKFKTAPNFFKKFPNLKNIHVKGKKANTSKRFAFINKKNNNQVKRNSRRKV